MNHCCDFYEMQDMPDTPESGVNHIHLWLFHLSPVLLLHDGKCAAGQHSTHRRMRASCGDDNEDCNCCMMRMRGTQIPDAWIVSGGARSCRFVIVKFRKVLLHLWSHCWTSYVFGSQPKMYVVCTKKKKKLSWDNHSRKAHISLADVIAGQFGNWCRCDEGNTVVWKNNISAWVNV